MSTSVPRTLSWQAHEYFHEHKTGDWFWALGIVAVTAAVLAILFSNVLFAVVIVLFAFVAMMQAHRKPRLVRYGLTPRGVRIEETLYPYITLDSFWIVDQHVRKQDPKLLIKSKKTFMPFLHVPVEQIDIEEVRNYLLQHIHEEEHEESLLEKVLEHFGL